METPAAGGWWWGEGCSGVMVWGGGRLPVVVIAAPQENPHRATWARKRCSVLTQRLFAPCHEEVPCQRFYDWCVFDACG